MTTDFGQEKGLNYGQTFFFWRSPEFGQKIALNCGEDFKKIFFIVRKKPPQSDSRLMKIWVRFDYCCFKLPTPLPLRNPGYAPGLMVRFRNLHCVLSSEKTLTLTVSSLRAKQSILFGGSAYQKTVWLHKRKVPGSVAPASNLFILFINSLVVFVQTCWILNVPNHFLSAALIGHWPASYFY